MPLAPTVKNYLLVLTSKLLDQDRKESAREARRGGGVNIYRMGLLLEAANLVAEDMRGREDEAGPEALAALKRSLGRRFVPGFPPLKAIVKLIDASPASLAYGAAQRPARAKSSAQLDREIGEILKEPAP